MEIITQHSSVLIVIIKPKCIDSLCLYSFTTIQIIIEHISTMLRQKVLTEYISVQHPNNRR